MVFPQLMAFAAMLSIGTIAAIGFVYYLNNQSQPNQSSRSQPEQSSRPTVRSQISKFDPKDEDTICTICMDKTTLANRWTLPCKHSFHVACLNKWIINKQECPNCRKQF